jgi:ferritin-like protein
MSSEDYHEPYELLSAETRDLHRAIVSLIEELEAVDWYQQRASAAHDPELRAVLEHHRDEEIEHAMMNLEWIRRRNSVFDHNLRTYLFSEGPITEVEEQATGGPHEKGTIERSPARADRAPDGVLGIGSLRPK